MQTQSHQKDPKYESPRFLDLPPHGPPKSAGLVNALRVLQLDPLQMT